MRRLAESVIEANMGLAKNFSGPISRAHALHLWHEMPRKNGMDTNSDYPSTSIYQRMRARLLRK